MAEPQTPGFDDVLFWIEAMRKDPELVSRLFHLWRHCAFGAIAAAERETTTDVSELFSVVVARGEDIVAYGVACPHCQRDVDYLDFINLMELLTVWSDQHPTLVLDLSVMQEIEDATCDGLSREIPVFGGEDETTELSPMFTGLLGRFDRCVKRIDLLCEVEAGRRIRPSSGEVSDTAVRVAKYIDKHPGAYGAEIAKALDLSHDNVRQAFRVHLKRLGYHNPGRGYYPPKRPPSTPND